MSDLSATDRCVKCGLCLPHCPTFELTGNEADSPRGRISLMQSLEEDTRNWSPGLFTHLDRCLQCQACEAMCPSRVPFGELMDTARARLEPHRQRSLAQQVLRRVAFGMIASPRWNKALPLLLSAYRRSGLRWLVTRLPGIPPTLRRLNQLLPTPPAAQPGPTTAPAAGVQGSVHLFTGCMGNVFDRSTLLAARNVLQQLGYQVDVTDGQACCGALHQHNGEPDTAARLATRNRTAFAGDRAPILATSSACSAQLRRYDTLYPQAQGFSQRVQDIVNFLATRMPAETGLQPFPETVAVHIPCSHRNALRQSRDVLELLEKIPGIKLLPVNPGGGCCGAAGSYMLNQPDLSDRLREQAVDRIAASGARLLVTSNIGCSLHVQAGLRARGLSVEVLHPVTLLERCLVSPAAGPI